MSFNLELEEIRNKMVGAGNSMLVYSEKRNPVGLTREQRIFDKVQSCNKVDELYDLLYKLGDEFDMYAVGSLDRLFCLKEQADRLRLDMTRYMPNLLTRSMGIRYKYLELMNEDEE